MKKLWWNIILILVIGSIIGGCKTSDKESSNASSSPVEFPDYFEKSYSHLDFKSEIVVSEEANINALYRLSMRRVSYDNEKAYEVLFDNMQVESTHQGDTLGESGNKILWIDYIGTKNEHLYVNSESLTFNLPFSSYVLRCLRPETRNPAYNLDKYTLYGQLSFADYTEGSDSIIEALKSIGFPVNASDFYIYPYAMKHEILEQEEYAMDMDGNEDTTKYKESWTSDDDCYYYTMRQKIEGLPLYYVCGGYLTEVEPNNVGIEAIYSKDGIQRFSIDKIFTTDDSESEKPITLMPLEDLAEKINEQYDLLISDTVYTVQRMELYMMAEQNAGNKYDVFPVWVLWMNPNNTDSNPKTLQNVINAVTGEIIS
jgi:hypothetical protein